MNNVSSFGTAVPAMSQELRMMLDNEHGYLADCAEHMRNMVTSLELQLKDAALPSGDHVLFERVKTTLSMVYHQAYASAKIYAPTLGKLKKALGLVETMNSKYNNSDLPISELRDVLTLFQQIGGEYATRYNVNGTAKVTKWYNKWI